MKWLRHRHEVAEAGTKAAREGLEAARRSKQKALAAVDESRRLYRENGFAEGIGSAMGFKK